VWRRVVDRRRRCSSCVASAQDRRRSSAHINHIIVGRSDAIKAAASGSRLTGTRSGISTGHQAQQTRVGPKQAFPTRMTWNIYHRTAEHTVHDVPPESVKRTQSSHDSIRQAYLIVLLLTSLHLRVARSNAARSSTARDDVHAWAHQRTSGSRKTTPKALARASPSQAQTAFRRLPKSSGPLPHHVPRTDIERRREALGTR